ncbi:MAG: hypothetical protein ACP5Q3_15000 [bacterium]
MCSHGERSMTTTLILMLYEIATVDTLPCDDITKHPKRGYS